MVSILNEIIRFNEKKKIIKHYFFYSKIVYGNDERIGKDQKNDSSKQQEVHCHCKEE